MSRFSPIHISFFGGLNEDENPDALGDHELTDAFNVWRRGRTTGTRPGTQKDPELYADDLPSTPTVCGLVDYRFDRDTDRDLIAMVPGKIYLDDVNELALGASGVVVTNAAEKPWTFAQHENRVYAAGGDVTAATPDTPWYWDGSAANPTKISILNLNSEELLPRWCFEWNNRIFAGGFPDPATPDATGGPGVVRFSALNQGDVWPEENTVGGFSAVGGLSSSGAEYVTGANSYRDNNGDFLLIFTNRFVYSYKLTGDPYAPLRQSDVIPHGCVSHHAYVNLGLDAGDGLYMSEHGIHSLRQSQNYGEKEDIFLSYKIRKTFDSINRDRLDQVQSAVWQEKGSVIWAVPTGSSTVNDTILELSVLDTSSGSVLQPGKDLTAENAVWHIWKLTGTGHTANILLSGQNAAGQWRIYGGNKRGQVFEFTESIYSDVGVGAGAAQPYTSRFQTKHLTLNSPFYRKLIGDTLVDLQPGGEYKPQIQPVFDYGRKFGRALIMDMQTSTVKWKTGGTAVWNQFKWGSEMLQKQSRLYTTGSGDTIGWKFFHTGTNEPFFVARLAAEVAQMGEAAQG